MLLSVSQHLDLGVWAYLHSFQFLRMQHVLIALIEMLVNAQVMNLVFLDVEFLIVGLYCLGVLQKVYHTPIFARIVIQRQDIIITLLVGGSVFENCGVFVVGGFEDDGNLTVPDLH